MSLKHAIHTATWSICVPLGALAVILVMLSRPLMSSLAINAANVCIVKAGAGCDVLLFSGSSRGEHAWLTYRAQEPELALETLERFLAMKPGHLIARFRLGEVRWRLGHDNDAIAVWKSLPNADVYFANRSAPAAEKGDVREAERLAEISQAIDPTARVEKRQMYKELCRAWRREQQPEQALPWCQLVAQALNTGWAQIELAAAQNEAGDYEAALESLERALDLGSEDSKGSTYQQLGETYAAMGQFESAASAYKSALRHGRSNQWVHFGLAVALLRSGNLQEACEHYIAAQKLGYQVPISHRDTFAVCTPRGE